MVVLTDVPGLNISSNFTRTQSRDMESMRVFLIGIILLIHMSHFEVVHAHDKTKYLPKRKKPQSQFLGMNGRDYFQLSASATKLLTAEGNNNPQVGPTLTTSKIDLSSNVGFELSYRIGFDFDSPFRTELEYSFWEITLAEATEEPQPQEIIGEKNIRANIPISGYIQGHSFSFNTFYTYAPGGDFNSYFGAGIGFSKIVAQVENSGTEQTEAPHVQGFIGVEYLLDQNRKITLGYKTRIIINPDMEVFKEAIIKHAVEVGVVLYFN